jgi:hypothetical protein
MMAVIHSMTQWFTHFWKVSDAKAKDFLGLGGFNLIRTEDYERLGGFRQLEVDGPFFGVSNRLANDCTRKQPQDNRIRDAGFAW